MSVALNNLNFMISLTDRVSGPMGKVMKAVDQASAGFGKGFTQIGVGAAGLVGAAYSVNKLLDPTKEMQRALGEVKSLGVADDTLNKLRDTALKFSMQYGESASGFVKASYDIQSAIAGLSGAELSRFTEVSAVLAKGTKANVADITNYVGTMYGIFQKSADAMGKAQWIEQMAAQTAMAVNIFKSDGRQMAASFTAIGASAQNFGVSMAEQFAVLGKLQATMSGSEAGTKYRSFLDNIGKAQEKLNLKFTDAQGHMLPIVDILGKIQKKFGDIDKVAESDLLKKAFGTDEAVALIKLLNNDLGGLKNNIADIGKQSGMDEVNRMANAMTDPWAKMKTGVDAISISIGTKLLPVLLPMIDSVHNMLFAVMSWIDANPKLAKYIGIATLAVFGATAAIALLGIGAGWATIMTTGWGLAIAGITAPLTGTILGITALIAAVGTAIIKWDEWGGAILYVGQAITDAFGITGILTYFWNVLTQIYNGWSMIFTIIHDNAGSIIGFIGEVVVAIGRIVDILGRALGFGPLLDWVKNLFNTIITGWKLIAQMVLPDWMQRSISGLNVGSVGINKPLGISPVSTAPLASPKGGGILKQMSSVMNANKSSTVGDIHMHNYGQAPTAAKFRDDLLFMAP